VGKRVVPIIPDEARTFGMEVLFREIGIYAPFGQKYDPSTRSSCSRTGEEGRPAARGRHHGGRFDGVVHRRGTSYATHGETMIPFYIFYSMFGFQRTATRSGRSATRAAAASCSARPRAHDAERRRAPARGRPQPRCSRRPCHASRLRSRVRVRGGADRQGRLERMYVKARTSSTTLTLYNQDYPMPPMPSGVEEACILRGSTSIAARSRQTKNRAQLIGSGVILLEALRAQEILARSSTSRRRVERHELPAAPRRSAAVEALESPHPGEPPRTPYVTTGARVGTGPVIAATDYMKSVPDMVSRWIPRPFTSLGTDGFGRSDTRQTLRRFFEIDAEHIVVATLAALASQGQVEPRRSRARSPGVRHRTGLSQIPGGSSPSVCLTASSNEASSPYWTRAG
jgi:pyruvate dehydrogenase E1 component